MIEDDLRVLAMFYALTYELLKRGYDEAAVRKVLGENTLRVMEEAENVARSLSASAPRWARRVASERETSSSSGRTSAATTPWTKSWARPYSPATCLCADTFSW